MSTQQITTEDELNALPVGSILTVEIDLGGGETWREAAVKRPDNTWRVTDHEGLALLLTPWLTVPVFTFRLAYTPEETTK